MKKTNDPTKKKVNGQRIWILNMNTGKKKNMKADKPQYLTEVKNTISSSQLENI